MRVARSLTLRILLPVVGVQLLVFAVGGWVLDSTMKLHAERQFETQVQPIRALINSVLAPPLFVEDQGALKRRAQEIMDANSSLAWLVVDDTDDRVLVEIGPVPHAEPEPSATLEQGFADGIYRLGFPLQLSGEEVGYVHVGVRLDALHAFVGSFERTLVGIGLVSLALSALLTGLTVWKRTRQLRELGEATDALARGEVPEVVTHGHDDEVGRLARAFNTMAHAVEERRQAHDRERSRLRAIADYTFAWEIWIDTDGRLIWTNPSALRVTGYTPEELLAMENFPQPLMSDDAACDQATWQRIMLEPEGGGVECLLQRRDGHCIWVAMYWQPLLDPDGRLLGKRASFVDISERRRAQESLEASLRELRASEMRQQELLARSERQQARFRALLSAMNLGILFETPEKRVEYVNPAFVDMWALDPEVNLIGRPVNEVLELSAHEFARPMRGSRYVLHVENTHEVSEQFEIHLGDGRILTQVSYPVHDNDGRTIGRLWLYEDVTNERQTAEQLIYLAERDSLTGLYNRHRFQIEMERMIGMSQRFGHRFALLYFDLDEFKYINDTFGHREGDTVLTRIAGELAQVVRKNDVLARLGGDEFAIITLVNKDLDEVKQLAHRIVNAVARIPFRFHSQNIRITTSIGISVYPDMARDIETLVAQADAAMYQAKAQGKNTWSMYDRTRDATSTMMAHMTWAQRIEHGLESNLFELHFQGVYRVPSRELAHLEALVRLRDSDDPDNLYMPGQFIPIAEKSGKVLAIDQWVVREVIRLLAEHPDMPPVAVNISGRSFDDPSLPQRIRRWLDDAGVDPERLLVELTETAAVSDIQDAQRFIEGLHQAGCRVCLDDFGAGFSSFAYLKHITADILKIDGQFIHDLPNNPENQIFLRAMLDVATGLRKVTIAEFVDSAAVFDMLGQFGIDLAQGYYLDKPRPDHPAIPRAESG